MKIELNTQVDKYLVYGCMRCKFGGTPQCKVIPWRAELELLRQIVLETGLKEEIKWGVPVYTHKGKNIVTVNALKASANIGFYKGVLLTDNHKILQQQGNLQSDRIIKFTNTNDIHKATDILKAYISEAIAIEESGKKVAFNQNPEPIPDELIEAFEADPAFRKAFYELTPGRQRGYIIHFLQPKQSQTRKGRIQKYKSQIFDGIGLNDKYNN
ncbi:MAG: YdeI/OmpD-associated family protein [Runella sp.]